MIGAEFPDHSRQADTKRRNGQCLRIRTRFLEPPQLALDSPADGGRRYLSQLISITHLEYRRARMKKNHDIAEINGPKTSNELISFAFFENRPGISHRTARKTVIREKNLRMRATPVLERQPSRDLTPPTRSTMRTMRTIKSDADDIPDNVLKSL